MLYFVCACVHTSVYSSYVQICNQWAHYSHGGESLRVVSGDCRNICADHGYQWYPSCSSQNCKQISQFASMQIYRHVFSLDFRPVFSMAFSRHMYDWLSPSYSFIFTFSSLLAFCLLLLLFFFSLELNFAILFLISLHFSVFFFNLTLVSPSPFLSFFLTSKTGGNLCLHLKSLS